MRGIVTRHAGTIQLYSSTGDPQDYCDDGQDDDLRDEPIIECENCQRTAKERMSCICDKCPSNKETKK